MSRSLLTGFVRRPIYVARIASAGTQLLLVLALGSVSHVLLGIYSVHTAMLAVLFQAAQFEGAHLAIGGVLPAERLRRIHRTTNVLWTVTLLVFSILLAGKPLALLFVLASTLNLSAEWAVSLATVDDRARRDDKRFHHLMLAKIVLADVILPLFLCLPVFIGIRGAWIPTACVALLLLNLFLIARFIGYPKRAGDLALPNWHLVYGVVIKRIDGTFIRLFTGATLGVAALGGLQVLLSISRVLTMLTPTWLTMNISKIVDQTRAGMRGLKKTLAYLSLTYVAYIIFAICLFASSKLFTIPIPDFQTALLVVLFFGNQNTKAVLRQQDLVSGRIGYSNLAVSVGAAGKCILALLLLPYGLLGILGAVLIVDVLIIALMLVMFMKSVPA